MRTPEELEDVRVEDMTAEEFKSEAHRTMRVSLAETIDRIHTNIITEQLEPEELRKTAQWLTAALDAGVEKKIDLYAGLRTIIFGAPGGGFQISAMPAHTDTPLAELVTIDVAIEKSKTTSESASIELSSLFD
jgi:hypothetical protein